MATKYTPGPWKAKINRTQQDYVYEENGTHIVCTINHFGTDKSRDNAYLIAAAPELLEACKKAVDWLEIYCEQSGKLMDGAFQTWNILSDAIQKAEGKS